MQEETIKKLEEQVKKSPSHNLREMEDYRDTWRIFRIMAELVEGYNFLSSFEREVTILGSARFKEDNQYYACARELGTLLGENGFTTITGGGPGIMEAANRGAFEVGGESVGLNIQLPFEQRINPYVKKSAAFYYFFTRKVMLISPANAFVLFPGGFGTLDEFFEIVDLMDLGMMAESPVVLVGGKFWRPILDFIKKECCAVGSISEEYINSWHLVETAKEAYGLIKDMKDTKNICDMSPNNFHCEGNIDWKIFRVMAELVEGFEFVTGLDKAVTVLGTKGLGIDSPHYNTAYKLGGELAERGYSVVTGGKFGIAEAANKGAFERGGVSVGIGMNVGKGRREVNHYLNKSILFNFPFTRKLIVTAPTKAFVFFPGGLGTMHQLFEVLTLMQTKKMEPIPVILVNHTFWQNIHDFIRNTLVHDLKTISEEDDELYQIVDDVRGVLRVIDK